MTKPIPPLRPTLLAVSLALALGACDGSAAPGDPTENTFTIRVGDVPAQTRRHAYFGEYVSEATGHPTFAILLGTDPIASALSLDAPAVGFVRDGADPALGAHALLGVNPAGEPPADAFVGFYFDPAEYVRGENPPRSGFYFTGGGTVRLDEIAADRVRGTFAMDAVEYAEEVPGRSSPTSVGVTVTGEFHAVRSEAFGGQGALLGRRPSWLDWLPLAGGR